MCGSIVVVFLVIHPCLQEDSVVVGRFGASVFTVCLGLAVGGPKPRIVWGNMVWDGF